jgi:hypothetical protein
MCRLSWNLGASTSRNPQGLSRPVMGLLYLYLIRMFILFSKWNISTAVKLSWLQTAWEGYGFQIVNISILQPITHILLLYRHKQCVYPKLWHQNCRQNRTEEHKLCHGSCDKPQASQHRGLTSLSGQSMWDVCWTDWQWHTSFPKYFDFSLSVSFNHCYTHIFSSNASAS